MWDRIKTWWAAEGALVGLQGASDRTLEDMGLERDTLREQVMGQTAQPAPQAAPIGPAVAMPCRC